MASTSPLSTLATWLEEARNAAIGEPDAMALATLDPDGAPSVRYVLCRGVSEAGLAFYTNYESRKARGIERDGRASATFYWHAIGRQARLEGVIEKAPEADSDAYFGTRPRGHQLSAWASPQSRAIPSLEVVRQKREELARRFGEGEIPRPPFWGGYLLRVRAVELWTRGDDRMHERVRFELDDGGWSTILLAP